VWERHVRVLEDAMSKVTVDTTINIEVEQEGGITAILTLTLEEARALKDELIRAVGAQNPPGYAPVLRPVGGFINKPDPDHVVGALMAVAV
jgi:hypothetical protein